MSPDGNGMSADVELVEPTGFGIILHLSLHGLPFKIFTLNREALSAGPKVKVSFPAQYLHVFDGEGKRAS
jgi:multiple sugar transport system ATP-binding protein